MKGDPANETSNFPSESFVTIPAAAASESNSETSKLNCELPSMAGKLRWYIAEDGSRSAINL